MSNSKIDESNLWQWLVKDVKALRQRARITRIENAVDSGTPDVQGTLDGGSFWMELKAVARPALRDTCLLSRMNLKPEQISFLHKESQAGGLAWVLLQVGSAEDARRYLIPGADVLNFQGSVPMPEKALVVWETNMQGNSLLHHCSGYEKFRGVAGPANSR